MRKPGTTGRMGGPFGRLRARRFPGGPVSGAAALPLPLLLAALLFGACARNERVAGGDDFPNSVETLGKTAAGEARDGAEWNAYKEAPATPPGVYDTAYVPDSLLEEEEVGFGAGALRRIAAFDGALPMPVKDVAPGRRIPGATVRLDTLIDEAAGTKRIAREQVTDSITARDTTWQATDSSGGKLLLRASGKVEHADGRVERFAFEDGDGDGALSPRAGSRSIADIFIAVKHPSGEVEEKRTRVAAGPDLDFNARGDNSLLRAETVLRAGADTLLKRVLRPVDGDSVIYDPRRDSNRVEVEEEATLEGGGREEVFYRSVVFPDSARNYPYRYRRVVEGAAGVTETVALGRDSLPDFAPGDTGRVLVIFASSVAADTLERAESVYRVLLSDTAGRFADNLLLRVNREKAFRHGAVSGLRYRLHASPPVPDGSIARAGSVDLRVDFPGGDWVGFAGEASESGMSGVWADSGDRTGVVHFDADGAIVTSPAP